MSDTPGPTHCHHLGRDANYCADEAVITIDYGFSGVGACGKHVTPVLLWCMGRNKRGAEPDNMVRVFPAWRYEELK